MKRKFGNIATTVLVMLGLTGCTAMTSDDFTNKTPTFVLEEYFHGKTRAWGLFEDRFGTVRRQFVVNINGDWDGTTLTLDEDFLFDDGEKDFRQWRIRKLNDGTYEGRADDVIGAARGVASGNSLHWTYVLDLKRDSGSSIKVKLDDWMFLQPGGVLLNRARMSKFGIELGQITISFQKIEEEEATKTQSEREAYAVAAQ